MLHQDRPLVEEKAVPKERVRLGKETVKDQRSVTGQVRKEKIVVTNPPPEHASDRRTAEAARVPAIPAVLASVSCHSVASDCQQEFGRGNVNRREDFGRFCGCGVTTPRRSKIRAMVARLGTGRSEPASAAPAPAHALRPEVPTPVLQLLAAPDDHILHVRRRGAGTRPRRARPILQPGHALGQEPVPPLVKRLPRVILTDRQCAATFFGPFAIAAAIGTSISATFCAMRQPSSATPQVSPMT